MLRALARRGFEITFFAPNAYERQDHRDLDEPDWAHVVVYECTREGLERALDQASVRDVLVKASGVGVFDYFAGAALAGAPAHGDTADHNAVNCTPQAVLNVSRESMARYGHSPAPRVFEAAGAGACLVTDAWKGIEQFLEPDREVLVAESGEDVSDHLASLTPERASRIGLAARRRVLADHTYAQRAEQVERVLEGADVEAVGA